MTEENVIYIGSKPVMNYCLAILTSLKAKGNEITLKARRRAISIAVDVAEVTKNRFVDDLKYEDIRRARTI
jgi:DNA-binding protein